MNPASTTLGLRQLVGTVAIIVAACSPAMRANSVQLVAAPDANNYRPVPVEFVIADTSLMAVLGGLSARQWFSQRERFLLEYPTRIRSSQLEVIPGVTLEHSVTHRTSEVVFLFAEYDEVGAHRLRLDLIGQPRVQFGVRAMEAVARSKDP